MRYSRCIGSAAVGTLAALLLALPSSALVLAEAPAQAASTPVPPPCKTFPSSSDFVSTIDNPYMTWIPGTQFTSIVRKDGELQKDVSTVSSETKMILGV